MYVLLQNFKTPTYPKAHKLSLLIKDGIIAEIGEDLLPPADCKIINCNGKTLLPSFVDLHAHFREPGLTHKEDIASGCRAAVHGGYTAVNLMANTKPICSNMQTVEYVQGKGKELGLCNLFQTVSITKDFDGKTIEHIKDLSGVKWLSDDGVGVSSTYTMLQAMTLAKSLGIGLMLHEEDPALTKIDMYLSEEIMTYRDVKLAVLTGCRVHFCHVSTIEAMRIIIEGKKQGGNITCEVTPHHLALNDSTIYNVAPPLREESHRLFLIDCLKSGFVDAISTDHAPHTQQEKLAGANGICGIELAFATCYTSLVRTGLISLSKLVQCMASSPAKLLNINAGVLECGYNADIVLVDLEKEFTVTEEFFRSKSTNTPLLGRLLHGEILLTIKEGVTVYEKADR